MISTFVLVPQLAQLPEDAGFGFGLSATEAGLLLAPGGLVSLLRRAVRRQARRAPRLQAAVLRRLPRDRVALLGMALAHGSPALVVLWAA